MFLPFCLCAHTCGVYGFRSSIDLNSSPSKVFIVWWHFGIIWAVGSVSQILFSPFALAHRVDGWNEGVILCADSSIVDQELAKLWHTDDNNTRTWCEPVNKLCNIDCRVTRWCILALGPLLNRKMLPPSAINLHKIERPSSTSHREYEELIFFQFWINNCALYFRFLTFPDVICIILLIYDLMMTHYLDIYYMQN